MFPAQFQYHRAGSIKEALGMLQQFGDDAKLLSGGHSLLPMMKLRLAQPAHLVDIGGIGDLAGIREEGGRIVIGAATLHDQVASSSLVKSKLGLLAECAGHIGDIQVRNRGTIGGSLAQAHPSADYPACILALDAKIVAASSSGERVIPAREFFAGMFTTALRPDEIITEIRVSKTAGAGTAYKKVAHPASGYAVVGVAAVVRGSTAKIDDVAVGITGVGEIAYRATAVENALRGKPASAIAEAAKHAADKVEALGDNYASAEYRRHLAQVYTRRALQEALSTKRK